MSFFPTTKRKVYESGYSKAARESLLGTATGEAPEQPVRQIAGQDPLQEWGARITSGYLTNPDTSAYDTALGTAGQYAAQGDARQLPGYQNILSKVMGGTNAIGGNLAKALAATGNAPARGVRGVDALGRPMSAVRERMTTASLPFLTEEGNRQFRAIMDLPQFQQAKEQSAANWIQMGQQFGQGLRALQQARNDAEYEAILRDMAMKYEIQPGMLQSLLVTPQPNTIYDVGTLGRSLQLGQFGKDLVDIYGNTIGAAFSGGGSAAASGAGGMAGGMGGMMGG